MHLLESVFSMIDLCDYLDFEVLDEPKIIREGDISWALGKDLCCRAAKLMQQFAPHRGVRITVRKNIPDGAGMGGGSSDAATCLIALNRLWDINKKRNELLNLAVTLGADVPFFIFGQTAFAQGVGGGGSFPRRECAHGGCIQKPQFDKGHGFHQNYEFL